MFAVPRLLQRRRHWEIPFRRRALWLTFAESNHGSKAEWGGEWQKERENELTTEWYGHFHELDSSTLWHLPLSISHHYPSPPLRRVCGWKGPRGKGCEWGIHSVCQSSSFSCHLPHSPSLPLSFPNSLEFERMTSDLTNSCPLANSKAFRKCPAVVTFHHW